MDGRTVLITGGNAGIGRATAQALAERGAEVIITSRDMQRGEEAVAAIESATGRRIAVMPMDLASFQSIRSFAAAFLARYESLHVLINNAGLVLSDRRTTAEGFEQTFGVNHLGASLLSRACATGSSWSHRETNLMATRRSRERSSARNTSPIPPAPRRLSMR